MTRAFRQPVPCVHERSQQAAREASYKKKRTNSWGHCCVYVFEGIVSPKDVATPGGWVFYSKSWPRLIKSGMICVPCA